MCDDLEGCRASGRAHRGIVVLVDPGREGFGPDRVVGAQSEVDLEGLAGSDSVEVEDSTIKDIRLEATYLDGVKVYTAPAYAIAMLPQPPINYGDGN